VQRGRRLARARGERPLAEAHTVPSGSLKEFAAADAPAAWAPPRLRPHPERLDAALDTLRGVGPHVRRRLRALGLETIRDLLQHRPRDYQRAVGVTPIADLFGEEEAVVVGRVLRVSERKTRRRLSMITATIEDETGSIPAVWFGQAWLVDKLAPGTTVRLRGHQKDGQFRVKSQDFDGGGATADLAPVYPASEELPAPRLRALVEQALPHVRDFPDPLPAQLKARRALPLKADALLALHRPSSLEQAERARSRLAFDELLLLQLGLARRRSARIEEVAPALEPAGELVRRYREVLPFRLTSDQERAIDEMDADLVRSVPMERLLQGDVGSGKTVVALYALLRAVESGRLGALMAPTETLAEQHFLTVEGFCRDLGVSVGLLTSSVGKRDRAKAAGAAILVGTHALIQEGVDLADLGVAVVDEQHRFGVEQRRALVSGRTPHVLHMTATPIPRTLALTVYGDLNVTEISRPPADRKPIVTAWVGAERSSDAYTRLRRHLDERRQAYVVCPLIEASQTSVARAAEAEAERLRQGELRGYRVGLLHGRLKPAERRELMRAFKACELDVLVATTVIEVGVDVPNATIMIVQEADRFGLAQLHQLRGRVGRGAEQSYCLLISRPKEELTEIAQERLQALVDTADGFELAEKDLELRGAGELLGTRQSGLTDFRFASLVRDRALLAEAREDAAALVDYEGPLADEAESALEATAATA
jgi:ATP-dependent DNA helicase RecG